MNQPHDPIPAVPGVTIRTYELRDQGGVSAMYETGLLAGQIAANDTGADIENIIAAYFDSDRHRFWVAEDHQDGRIVGMIGVNADDHDTAEIRRLRVAPSHQSTELSTALLRTALNHCRHHGYLKIRLDTRFEKGAAVEAFDRIGFQHTRAKTVHGKEVLEFYLDLYRQPNKDTV